MGASKTKFLKLGNSKSRLPKPLKTTEHTTKFTSNSDKPKDIRITFYGDDKYIDIAKQIVEILIKHNPGCSHWLNENWYGLSFRHCERNISLTIDVGIPRKEWNIGCGRYDPFKRTDAFIIIGDLGLNNFLQCSNIYIKEIRRNSRKWIPVAISGFDYEHIVRKYFLLSGRNPNNIFSVLPIEVIHYITMLICKNTINFDQLYCLSHRSSVYGREVNIREVNSLDVPFMYISLDTGENIEQLFMDLIQKVMELESSNDE
jgi:hypothetical protein